jgi:AraC-like DNA-binding protein
VRGVRPLVAHALARFDIGESVDTVVADSGYSHRHVVRTFEQAVGLKPKTYGRLRRFDRVLARLAAEPDASWADLAAAEGYTDQAHLIREFRSFAGVTPGRYRRIAPVAPRHVPFTHI